MPLSPKQKSRTDVGTLIDDAVRDFRHSWKQLVLTDIVYKVIALILLTPLVAILLRPLFRKTRLRFFECPAVGLLSGQTWSRVRQGA